MTKQQIISAMILKAMQDNGGDIAKAFDSVFGAGAYMELAGDVYKELRARNGL